MINPVITNAMEIMETYKKFKDAPIPIREAMCIKVQYPGLLPAPKKDDIFAGRTRVKRIAHVGSFAFVGTHEYTPENESFSKIGGFLFDHTARHTMDLNDEELKLVNELEEYWLKESNQAKVENSDLEFKSGTGFTGATDLDMVVKKGLPGLRADVTAMPEGDFRSGLLLLLESIEDVFRFYLKSAEEIGNEEVATTMHGLLEHAPATVAEALQLILILEVLWHERHYEINQLDMALGDLYAKELEAGTLTEEQAIRLIRGFYETINENGDEAVCRLVMGGKNRRNEANADRFITAALKAEQLHKRVTPQVTIRIYNDMNPDILKLSYDTIRETGTFPLIYNDDAVIPSVAKAFDISMAEAEYYFPLGCGEFILAPYSPALFLISWDVPRTIDEAVRNSSAKSFDDLYKDIMAHANAHAGRLAKFVDALCDIHNSQSTFLMASLVTNDCIARNKPILDGGARYIGSAIMGHGYTNGADALTAIKKLVFEEKQYTLSQIIEALDANFNGYDEIHKAILAVPKYGNDNTEADEMVARIWSDLGVAARKASKDWSLDFLTLASANPGGHMFGKEMSATADGRLEGVAYAICNSPTAGNDKNGLTAMMNSILKGTPENGGATTNFKITKDLIVKEREKFEALFSTYWVAGGQQASFAVVNRGDLEAALKEPHKHPNLMVRMGGWTARFVELEPYAQEEILRRTLH